jgi:uncharacterized protein (DUF433 family)
MEREEAIRKIAKCLALAKGADGPVAAAALRQAQALMREHQLDEQGVAIAEVREERVKAAFVVLTDWEATLSNLVADAFACEVFTSSGWQWPAGRRVEQRTWVFIGVGAAAQVAAYAFEVLARQCKDARRLHISKQSKNCKASTKAARGDAFARGWVESVRDLVERFANGERNQQLLAQYMAAKYPNLGKAKVTSRNDSRKGGDSRFEGILAGQKASLHNGVGGPQERLRLQAPGGV